MRAIVQQSFLLYGDDEDSIESAAEEMRATTSISLLALAERLGVPMTATEEHFAFLGVQTIYLPDES